MLFNVEHLSSYKTLDDMLDHMPSYGAVFTTINEEKNITDVKVLYERRCKVRGKQTRAHWGFVDFVKEGVEYGR